MWVCKCECGTIREVAGSTIKNGRSKSCGCLQKESVSAKNDNPAIARTHEYVAWQTMKRICHNPCHTEFSKYGQKGIHVCPQWFNSFNTFINDMGKRPHNFKLKRIDNNKNYSPNNCIWEQ